jgi:hypothetical protein
MPKDKPVENFNAKEAARKRAEQTFEFYDDTEYKPIIRTRVVRRELNVLLGVADRAQLALDDTVKAAKAGDLDAEAKISDQGEAFLAARAAVIARLVAVGADDKAGHPDPERIADEVDWRDIHVAYGDLMGARLADVEDEPDPTNPGTSS